MGGGRKIKLRAFEEVTGNPRAEKSGVVRGARERCGAATIGTS